MRERYFFVVRHVAKTGYCIGNSVILHREVNCFVNSQRFREFVGLAIVGYTGAS